MLSKSHTILLLGFLLVLSQVLFALQPDELTPEQKKLQADLEAHLMAPCCWGGTVDQHDSPQAREVREKVTELIKQGKTRQEILDYFVAQPQYGERILAVPSQKSLMGKLAYWLIPIAIVFGLAMVAVYLRRSVKSGSAPAADPTAKASPEVGAEKPKTGGPATWEDRVEKELNEFD